MYLQLLGTAEMAQSQLCPFFERIGTKEWISNMSHNISFKTYYRDSVGGASNLNIETFIGELD